MAGVSCGDLAIDDECKPPRRTGKARRGGASPIGIVTIDTAPGPNQWGHLPMTIHLHCSSCQAGLKVPDAFAGKTGKCPKCGAKMRIPGGATPADPVQPARPAAPAPTPPTIDETPSVGPPPVTDGGLDLGASVGLADAPDFEDEQYGTPDDDGAEEVHLPEPTERQADRKRGRRWLFGSIGAIALGFVLIVVGALVESARGPLLAAGGALICLTVIVTFLAGWWGMFTKAGKPGWAVLIPFWNIWVMCEVAGRPGWWMVLLLIPVVGVVIGIMLAIDLAKAFGRGVGTILGLIFLPVVFIPILGLGESQWSPGEAAPPARESARRAKRQAPGPMAEPESGAAGKPTGKSRSRRDRRRRR